MNIESITNMQLSRRLASVAFAAVVASLVATSAQAFPVTYHLVSGSLDTVQLRDPTGATAPCPLGSAIDCLVDPLAIDGGSVTIDLTTGQILDLNISMSGTGELALGGLNGWESGFFTGASYQTSGASFLGDYGGGRYHFLHLAGTVNVDLLEMFAVGNAGPVPDYSGPYTAPSRGPNGDFWLSGDAMSLTLRGIDIGFFPDPVSGQPVFATADFSLVAVATAPIPEPGAATLFGIGFLIAGIATRRRRAA